MSLLGFIGKALTFGVDVATGNVAGAVATATSIIKPSSTQPTAMPGSGQVIGTSVPVTRRAIDVVSSMFAPGEPGQPGSIFTTALPTPDSVVVKGSGVMTPIGSAGSASATAYFSNSAGTALACVPGARGHHLNKTAYTLKNGTRVEKGTRCVSNRRRNPLNPRALNRAVSRVAAAKRYAKLLDRIEIKGRARRR